MSTATLSRPRSRNSRKATLYAFHRERGEVFERTPDHVWTQKLEAWRKAIEASGGCYAPFRPVVASPMPHGHIMFTGGYGADYERTDTLPEPLWSDGVRCLYLGQCISWQQRDLTWRYGRITGLTTDPYTNGPAVCIHEEYIGRTNDCQISIATLMA